MPDLPLAAWSGLLSEEALRSATEPVRDHGLGGIPGRITPTSLELQPSLPFDRWAIVGGLLGRLGRGLQWWIGDWLAYGEHTYGETYSQALDATKYDYQTLANMAWVSSRFEISRRRENLTWAHHAEVAALEQTDQKLLLDMAEAEGWSRAKLRQGVRDLRWRRQLGGPPPLPQGPVPVIYADPPWSFSNAGFEQAAAAQYPTLPTDEVCALPIRDLAAEQAALFLWVPNALLPDGLRVCKAWEFEYKTYRVWLKGRSPGMGWHVVSKHETLLIATRGDGMVPRVKPDSYFEADAAEHSRKPDCVYADIEAMYPGPYLELFARRPRDGWIVWGNEVGDLQHRGAA